MYKASLVKVVKCFKAEVKFYWTAIKPELLYRLGCFCIIGQLRDDMPRKKISQTGMWTLWWISVNIPKEGIRKKKELHS